MVARNRLVISGALAVGQERWSVGLNFAPGSGALLETPAELTAWAVTARSILNGLPASHNLLKWLGNAGDMRRVDTYFYPGPGPALAQGQATFTPAKPGTDTANQPLQVARVITLDTALAGRRHRGRIYWPSSAATINVDGTALTPSAAATEVAALLDGLGAYGEDTDRLEPAVYSEVGNELTVVSRVRIGNVLDTQRRRSKSIPQTYVAADLPT